MASPSSLLGKATGDQKKDDYKGRGEKPDTIFSKKTFAPLTTNGRGGKKGFKRGSMKKKLPVAGKPRLVRRGKAGEKKDLRRGQKKKTRRVATGVPAEKKKTASTVVEGRTRKVRGAGKKN